MSIVYLLLPIALLMGFAFLGAFMWTASEGQYDDLETPAHRILLSDVNETERSDHVSKRS